MIDDHGVALREFTSQQLHRQRTFDVLLQRTPQRPGAEGRIKAFVGQPGAGIGGQVHIQAMLGQPLAHLSHLQIDDQFHMLHLER